MGVLRPTGGGEGWKWYALPAAEGWDGRKKKHCLWQPNYCYFERKENNNNLDDDTFSYDERAQTVEGYTYSGNAPIQSPSLLSNMKRACNATLMSKM